LQAFQIQQEQEAHHLRRGGHPGSPTATAPEDLHKGMQLTCEVPRAGGGGLGSALGRFEHEMGELCLSNYNTVLLVHDVGYSAIPKPVHLVRDGGGSAI